MAVMTDILSTPGDTSLDPGEARCPGPSVQDVLTKENSAVDPGLTDERYEFLGDEDLPFSRYTSQEMYDLEIKNMWGSVCQFITASVGEASP